MPDLFLQIERDGETAPPPPLPEDEVLALLRTAEITAARLIPWGSNYTFGVALSPGDGPETLAIYKPRAGETPLYDFPDGTLFHRETAAYLLSHHLGWHLVPPTVVREGPNGIGSLQLYVQPDGDTGDPSEFWGQCLPEIERMVMFDHLANNADRKIGHCLRDPGGRVWGIDHGLTFNTYPKLRTVLWQFVGDPVSPGVLADLRSLRDRAPEVGAALAPHLAAAEIDAVFTRVEGFLIDGTYPRLSTRRNVPWGWW